MIKIIISISLITIHFFGWTQDSTMVIKLIDENQEVVCFGTIFYNINSTKEVNGDINGIFLLPWPSGKDSLQVKSKKYFGSIDTTITYSIDTVTLIAKIPCEIDNQIISRIYLQQ